MKIGIFDSGIGGINVLKNLLDNFSNNEIYYLADTLRMPYGIKSNDEILKYSRDIARFLKDLGAEILIIACNTATSVSLEILKKEFEDKNFKIYGVIDKTIDKIIFSKSQNIGILATDSTIENKKYENKLKNINSNLNVYGIKASTLATLIENNEISNIKKNLEIYLKNYIEKIDTIVLACTHYSLIKGKLNEMYPNINIIDSSYEVINSIDLKKVKISKNNKVTFYVTGDLEKFKLNLEEIFKMKNQNIIKKEW